MGLKEELDKLYLTFNHRKFVHPDPLEFLYNYDDIRDREIAGLISSTLSYGRVSQILKSVSLVLDSMGSSPYFFIMESSPRTFYNNFKNFKHRFTTGDELCCLLEGIKKAIEEYGSLNNCFLEGSVTDKGNHEGNIKKRTAVSSREFTGTVEKVFKEEAGCGTVVPAILNFAEKLNFFSEEKCTSLIPYHSGSSAFKRLNLYLRWMVRKDRVDPGGWYGIPASGLIVPLDTHMHRISAKLGFTNRKQADIKTAVEITGTLKKFDRDDPVKYDFALTRLGMNKMEEILFKKIF